MKNAPYNSLVVYTILMGISLYLFSQGAPSLRETGFLLLGWSILAGYVFLWLMNRYDQLTKQADPKHAHGKMLPTHLLRNMHSRQSFDSGIRALKTYNSRLALFAFMFGLYLFWGALLVFIATRPEPLIGVQTHIQEFFIQSQMSGLSPSWAIWPPAFDFLIQAAHISILALIFWMSRILVNTSRMGRYLPWGMMGVFILLCMIFSPYFKFAQTMNIEDIPWIGYGWGQYDFMSQMGVADHSALSGYRIRQLENGHAGAFIFGAFIFFIFIMGLRNLFHTSVSRPAGFTVILVLAALAVIDIYLAARPEYFALYLSGFSVIAGLSVQNRTKMRKHHTLYQ